jgi:hypothetical protein
VRGETRIAAKTIGEYLNLCFVFMLDDVRLSLLEVLLITNNFCGGDIEHLELKWLSRV